MRAPARKAKECIPHALVMLHNATSHQMAFGRLATACQGCYQSAGDSASNSPFICVISELCDREFDKLHDYVRGAEMKVEERRVAQDGQESKGSDGAA